MVKVYNKETDEFLAEITEAQLEFLIEQLEEESSSDNDYYINETTLDMLERAGADAALLRILRGAMGQQGEIEIRWTRA